MGPHFESFEQCSQTGLLDTELTLHTRDHQTFHSHFSQSFGKVWIGAESIWFTFLDHDFTIYVSKSQLPTHRLGLIGITDGSVILNVDHYRTLGLAEASRLSKSAGRTSLAPGTGVSPSSMLR
jgi:hypothetical protein